MVLKILFIIFGFIILVKGADLLLKSAISIAKKFGISEILIGLTILAVGTSLPEIFITITSAIDNHQDLIIGNAIGSCVCNFLFVIGIVSLVRPINFDKKIVKKHFPIGIILMLLLLFLINTNKLEGAQTVTRWQGALLIFCTILYIIYSIYVEKNIHNEEIDDEIVKEVKENENYSVFTIILYMILGILGLKFGSDFVVDNSIQIAKTIGLSESFIGMTIIAIGTSLPEITTGIISAINNKTDLLLGNIIGSNIINLSLLIGVGAIIKTLVFTTNFNISLIVLILITIMIQLITSLNRKEKLSRKIGVIFIILYFIYIFVVA